MPSYAFKRPPTSTADYKLIDKGDKYTFFGETTFTKVMGSVVNYKVAQFILTQAAGWSNVSEQDYESKKETLKGGLETAPSNLGFPDIEGILVYYYYDPFDSGEGTWFAIYMNQKAGIYFSETMNVSDSRQEYNILRNTQAVYVENLFYFLKENGKFFDYYYSESYNKTRERAYTYSWTEAVGEELPVDKG
jgi:hypothetical protein